MMIEDIYGLRERWKRGTPSYTGNTGIFTEAGLYVCVVGHEVADHIVNTHNAALDRPTPPDSDAVTQAAERLTPYRERVIRSWPRDRIKPLTVARCLDSLLAELDALRDIRCEEKLVSIVSIANDALSATASRPSGEDCCSIGAELGTHNPFACQAYDNLCPKCRHIQEAHWSSTGEQP